MQGVGFRYSAVYEARLLGLKGWVRNLDSGDEVEVWAEGERAGLDAFLAWLEQGPPGARVLSVRSSPREPVGYLEFDVEY